MVDLRNNCSSGVADTGRDRNPSYLQCKKLTTGRKSGMKREGRELESERRKEKKK
jgi:hypothetical protein